MICRYCNGTGTSNTCVNGTFKPCAACNGTGEEREEKITNFDRVTASPEALAKWVFNTMDFCSRGCSNCPIKEKCLSSNSKGTEMDLLEWLNEESKE